MVGVALGAYCVPQPRPSEDARARLLVRPRPFTLKSVRGIPPNAVAVIESDGQIYEGRTGTEVPEDDPKFEVKEVKADSVTVLDCYSSQAVTRKLNEPSSP